MYHDGKHICMLKTIPPRPCRRPLEGWFRRRWCNLRSSMLACPWYYSSKLFLRSEYGIDKERERQLNSKWWMIMHPYSAMRFYWDCFSTIVYVFSLLYLPLQVFIICPNRHDPYILFTDAVGFLAIGFNFVTGCVVEDGKKIGLEPVEIARRYIKDNFVFDVISALPLQCVALDDDCNFPTYTVLYLLKLFRVTPVANVIRKLGHQFRLPYLTLVLVTVCLHILVFYHWMTFCHYQVPLYYKYVYPEPNFKLDDWLRRVKAMSVDNEHINLLEKYIINLYYVTGLCIGAGVFSLVEPNSQIPEQQVVNACVGIIGLLFMTYTFTSK
ncbi:potassium/sodium hyperpolarization-activated cyclic nucleotide-gated channel 1-like [Pectinophora gossypiella]|uniref:potassium/sodium hyperpolarization-activated cyclic nucleotide-gated channel 1-like n=1 Tax=Pectinophora gossypiella TaxID=13191 RepID=UPI00214EB032|nr:potassium/sodium hyperpolarization-activated cyclic nucleotide-gated channel 1-like [Pectinophora gossypiella]